MAIDGIWTSEVYGPFGWENHGVLVLERGRILGGGNRHYSFGQYRQSGETMEATLKVEYFGPPRTMFGEANEEFELAIEGAIKDGVIEGSIRRPDKPQFDLQMRMTRRMDVPTL